jgi:hypothetical protein
MRFAGFDWVADSVKQQILLVDAADTVASLRASTPGANSVPNDKGDRVEDVVGRSRVPIGISINEH